jgi:DNA end-binding protein Ku
LHRLIAPALPGAFPYYIAPDGEVGQQAFAVIREAIRKEGMVAIGKVVFTSREHIIALEAGQS